MAKCLLRAASRAWQKPDYGTELTLYQTTKYLALSKLKAFADDKLNVTQNIKVVFHRIENIVGKEENAGYQHLLFFPQCIQNAF